MRKFSVVIILSRGLTGEDRRGSLDLCLRSLALQSYPHDLFEVILVDSGSGLTYNYLDTYRKSLELKILFIGPNTSNIGPARARNLGIKEASFDYIAFTDDDSEVPPDWLEKIDAGYEHHPHAAAVGGLTLPPPEIKSRNIFAYFDYKMYLGYLKNGKMIEYVSEKRDEHPVFSGNISYRKDGLRQSGFFDESYLPIISGEDGDLKERALKYGEFVFVPTVVTHRCPYNLKRFYYQQLSRGASILRFRKDHGLENHPALIVIRLLAAIFLLPYQVFKEGFDFQYALVSWLSLVFRNLGKLRYYHTI